VRILLTGAAGFIGSHLLRQLVRDHHVAFLVSPATDRWRILDVEHRATRIDADIREVEKAASAIAHFAPETVVHLAWSGVTNSHRNDRSQIENLHATLALIDVAHAAGARAFVGVGSQAEYGPSSGALDESSPTQPTTLYGITKLSTCLFARQLCDDLGVRFAWVRLFSSYGPMDDESWLIPSMVLTLLAGGRPKLTLGEQRWDYVYVKDAADALARVALAPTASGIFNLGSGTTATIRSITEQVRDLIDPSLPLGFGEVPYRPDQVMHLEARTDRLRAIGWSPTVGLAEGLSETVAYFRAHRHRDTPAA
jgi:nucleoside-diphosphate-sugar epimerase